MKPSKYQEQIYDFISNGVGNAVINAKAGSGKTTTAVNALSLIPENKSTLYIAFNKSIVNELKSRIGERANIHISTFHSLGYSILRENYGNGIKLEQFKYTTYIKKNIMVLSDSAKLISNQSRLTTFFNSIISLLNFSRFNMAQSEKEIQRVAQQYGIPVIGDECETVMKVLQWGQDETDSIDYTDMIWLPCNNNLSTKRYRFNWVFIDEAQDSSIVEQALIKKCMKRGARFVAIGDESQCINAFAGSNPEAFKKYLSEPNTKELKLSISYRCPKRVVELAQEYVPDIEYAEDAIEGSVNYDVSPFDPKSGDMVLCRNTAPLVKLYIDYLKVNKKSYVKGGDIGDGFIKMLNGINKEELSLDLRYDGVFPRLYERLFTSVEDMVSKDKIGEEEAFGSSSISNMYDSIQAMEAIAEGLETKEELISKIKAIFLDSDGDGVCLSTVHKSKGLEADNVFILCKSLMPSKNVSRQWEIDAENNLIYVAITRAKKSLSFIDEKQFFFNSWEHKKDFETELKSKRRVVYSILGKDPDFVKNIMAANYIVSEDVRAIGEIKDGRSKFSRNSKKKAGNRFSKFIK